MALNNGLSLRREKERGGAFALVISGVQSEEKLSAFVWGYCGNCQSQISLKKVYMTVIIKGNGFQF